MRNGYDPNEAPALEGWMTASQVAAELSIARQSVNRMIHEGQFKTLRRLGERPIFVVKTTEVNRMKPKIEKMLAARRA